MLAQKFQRGRGILDGFCFIEALIERECFLPFGFALVSHIDAALLSPEQIGTDGYESVRRIPIANIAHVFVHAKDFLQDNDAWAKATGRQSHVRIKLAAVE